MVLVDTSVWIDHLRGTDSRLAGLLEDGAVAVHPFVIGELACGTLANRAQILSLLDSLPSTQRVEDGELLYFIDQQTLHGRGLGLIDMHLLASSYLAGQFLWSNDRRLKAVAIEMGIDFEVSGGR